MLYSFGILTCWLCWLICLDWDFQYHDFMCFINIFVWDIDMLDCCWLIVLYCLAHWLWFWPEFFFFFWSPHMHTLTTVYRLAWYVDSLACILFWSSFEHDVCITIPLIVVFSLILCVDMMIYLSTAWLHVAWLPSSAWLSVACSCGSRIYPLISNPLVSIISFISVIIFASVRPCVCLYSDQDRG